MIAQPWVAAGGFLLGLIFGSFFAALIQRWPRGRSVLQGRSACDDCGRVLMAVELIPLLSALAQRGRCRTCGVRIDPLHWRIELACALIGAVAASLAPFPQMLAWMVLGWLLLVLAVLDARHFWLPDALTLPLVALGLLAAPFVTGVTLEDGVIGATAGYAVLLFVAAGYRTVRGRDGLGMGDAKLLGGLGAWFGWQALPFIVLASSLLGLSWALARVVATGERLNGQTMLPLGTCLAAVAIPAGLAARLLLLP